MRVTSRPRRGRAAIPSQREAVERAEAYLRANMGDPVPISRLCQVVGLSERGLRNAFYGVRGMSPKRCMLAERLESVRRALKDGCTGPITVTSIATHYGFYELGRFAATYKQAFGEPPSATLRRTGRQQSLEHKPNTKGHVDACTT